VLLQRDLLKQTKNEATVSSAHISTERYAISY